MRDPDLRRPADVWIRFVQAFRARHPELRKDVFRRAAKEWRSLSAAERAPLDQAEFAEYRRRVAGQEAQPWIKEALWTFPSEWTDMYEVGEVVGRGASATGLRVCLLEERCSDGLSLLMSTWCVPSLRYLCYHGCPPHACGH